MVPSFLQVINTESQKKDAGSKDVALSMASSLSYLPLEPKNGRRLTATTEVESTNLLA